MATLPAIWQEALRRERARPALSDPLPERRLARLLAAFIGAGLFFLVAPGTLMGVWNLIGISSKHNAEGASQIWIQAHGHAQLFGWVGTFMIGISLYTVPKFRGAWIRSLGVGWLMLALWTAALAARWASAVWQWHWKLIWPLASAAELAVALLLIWQCTAPSRRRPAGQGWTLALIFAGFGGLVLTFALQLAFVLPPPPEPLIPAGRNALLLHLALWAFCFPVAWGFSNRFLPSFLALAKPNAVSGWSGLGALGAGLLLVTVGESFAGAALILIAVLAACRSLGIFGRSERAPKTIGVDPRYPWFTRAAFGWLIVSALLAFGAASPGMAGASRHAFTVGFLATLIFAIGPRILPAFLNSRELWSPRLMLASLVALSAGCALRVTTEPLAYSGIAGAAWSVLPWSALTELTAVLLFAVNIGMTLASPIPAWIVRGTVTETITVYWLVSSYPETRRMLVAAGLSTLARAQTVPRTLTLGEAAAAEGLDPKPIVALLQEYFDRRLARALRKKEP